MSEETISLAEMLLRVEDIPWRRAVFLPTNVTWSLDTQGAILAIDNLAEDEEPDLAVQLDLSFVLDFGDFRGIVRNARQQLSNPTLGQLFEAFEYYMKNDAFLEF